MDIVSISEAVYLVYMYIYYKTSYSIHHPFEYMVVESDLWKHPINTGAYENKICELGSYASIVGAILLIYRGLGNKTSVKVTRTVILTWSIIAFMATKDIASALIAVVALVVSMQTFKNHEMKIEINKKIYYINKQCIFV